MLTLTRKTDYALVALAHLAETQADSRTPVSARLIADQYVLPIQVLVKVLKDLQKAGIVASTRGAHGGYYLGRQADQISIADVADAMEGRVRLTPCCDESNGAACQSCATQPVCPISGRVRRINDTVRAFFRRITIQDLLSDELNDVLTGAGAGIWPRVRGTVQVAAV